MDPQPGEWEGVRERLEALRCREEILEAARLVDAELDECDGAVLSRLGALERQLRATRAGERFEPVIAALINAAASCDEALGRKRGVAAAPGGASAPAGGAAAQARSGPL